MASSVATASAADTAMMAADALKPGTLRLSVVMEAPGSGAAAGVAAVMYRHRLRLERLARPAVQVDDAPLFATRSHSWRAAFNAEDSAPTGLPAATQSMAIVST
jgi:hypothetical protein